MKINYLLATIAIVLGLSAAFTKHAERNGLYPEWKFSSERIDGKKVRLISASHLANLIYKKDPHLMVFDAREWSEYEQYHIPKALHYDAGMEAKTERKSGIIVVYGKEAGEDLSELARKLPGRVYILKGGLEAWKTLVLFPDFLTFSVRNGDLMEHILRRSSFFGGKAQNSQLMNIEVRESRYREGC